MLDSSSCCWGYRRHQLHRRSRRRPDKDDQRAYIPLVVRNVLVEGVLVEIDGCLRRSCVDPAKVEQVTDVFRELDVPCVVLPAKHILERILGEKGVALRVNKGGYRKKRTLGFGRSRDVFTSKKSE